jgi:hypothetical protein
LLALVRQILLLISSIAVLSQPQVDILDARAAAEAEVAKHFDLASASREAQVALHLAYKNIDSCKEEKHKNTMIANFITEADVSAGNTITYDEYKVFLKRHSTFSERERIGLRGKFF